MQISIFLNEKCKLQSLSGKENDPKCSFTALNMKRNNNYKLSKNIFSFSNWKVCKQRCSRVPT